MTYEELHQRFGTRLAQRVAVDLSPSELEKISLDDLTIYLERRAERAQKEYQDWLDYSLHYGETAKDRMPDINVLHDRWRAAEDLAYLVAIAEDVRVDINLAV